METFDAIVVGLGAHGSATAATLARRGLRVLGLERFGRGETRGSSGGRSRIIRIAHYESPSYAPLARAARDRWLALEAEAGARILTVTGGLYAGPRSSELVAGALRAATTEGIDHEIVDADEIRRRWPAFNPAEDAFGIVEADAGMLDADAANAAHLDVAERHGAVLRFGARVVSWRPLAGGGVEVGTSDGGVSGAARLVLTTGPWLVDLVPDLRPRLSVERQPVCWFKPALPIADVSVGRLPIWLMTTETGTFYGFPHDPELGLKVARHHTAIAADAETVDRTVGPADEDDVRAFIRTRMPGADGPLRAARVCLYTNTPDEEFIVDRHPAVDGVAFASACSGHGFKFAPVIGEMLADLVMGEAPPWPVEAFGASRFATESAAVQRSAL